MQVVARWKMEMLWADSYFGLYNTHTHIHTKRKLRETIKNHSDFSSRGYLKIQFKKVINRCCCWPHRSKSREHTLLCLMEMAMDELSCPLARSAWD